MFRRIAAMTALVGILFAAPACAQPVDVAAGPPESAPGPLGAGISGSAVWEPPASLPAISPAPDLKIGDTFTTTYADAIVTYRVYQVDMVGRTGCGDTVCLGIQLQIRVEEGSYSTSGSEIVFRGASGEVYDTSYAFDDDMEYKTILKGQILEGWRWIEVKPKDVGSPASVLLVDSMMIDPIAVWSAPV